MVERDGTGGEAVLIFVVTSQRRRNGRRTLYFMR